RAASGVHARPLFTTRSALYPAFLADRGTVDGYQVVPVPRSAIASDAPDYRGEVFLDRAQEGARVVSWSPNRIEVALDVSASDLVIVNQNFDRGWRIASDPRRAVLATRGLVSARVGPGDASIVFEYRPRSVVAGTWISAISFASLIPLARWLR